MAETEVDKIMAAADADGNGEIEYSEWITATINKERLLSDEKLMAAFKLFDKDGGGTIQADELKSVLGVGKKFDEQIWKDIIADVDGDGDGNIDYDEFKTMMQKLIKD